MRKWGRLTLFVGGNLAILYTSLNLAAPVWWRLGQLGSLLIMFNVSFFYWQPRWHDLWCSKVAALPEFTIMVLAEVGCLFLQGQPVVQGGLAWLWQAANVVNYFAVAWFLLTRFFVIRRHRHKFS